MLNHHLLCTLSSSPSILLFFFFFLSFHGVHSAFSTICDDRSSPSPCGNIPIQYPFWHFDDAPHHCGYPGLSLSCLSEDNYPILSLGEDTYFVTDINYDNKTLTLFDFDIDIPNEPADCPRVRHNVTIGSLPLDYNAADVHITFFFNCSNPLPATIPAEPIDCLQSGDKQSYVFVDMSPEKAATNSKEWGCEDSVVAAVKQTEVTAKSVVEEFARAMRNGFVLDWETAKDCATCEHSGGRCAVGPTELLLCFCNDGSIHSDGSFCKAT